MSDTTSYDEMKADREARKAAQNAEELDSSWREVEKLRATLQEILSVTERQTTPTFNAISEVIREVLEGPTVDPEIVALRYNSDRQKYEPSEPAPASAPSIEIEPGDTVVYPNIHASAPSCCWEEAAKIAETPEPDDDNLDRQVRRQVADQLRARAAPCQCGELREALERGHRKLATYQSVYSGDKELRALLLLWNSVLSTGPRSEAGK